VRMTYQENPDVIESEPELLDASPNKRNALLQVAVDEDVALRCRNPIIRKPLAPYLVQVACDAKRRERFGPVGIALTESASGNGQNKD